MTHDLIDHMAKIRTAVATPEVAQLSDQMRAILEPAEVSHEAHLAVALIHVASVLTCRNTTEGRIADVSAIATLALDLADYTQPIVPVAPAP